MRAVSNPKSPWATTEVELLEPAPDARLDIWEEEAKSILAENDSPDVGFRFSLNPYRGCFHACAYCYARPTHQYLDWGAGTDFDRRILVKTNAPELLRKRFMKKSWQGELIAFSGNTDCYQPLEATYRLTRRCLELCAEFGNPVAVITKGALVRRDADVLAELSRTTGSKVVLSIPFADDETARAIEPTASSISARFEALRILSEAGVKTGVAIAPIIPGLNESHIPEILERAKDAGATSAFRILLRLPAEVRPLFESRLEEALPLKSKKVLNAMAEMRGGRMNDPRFGSRMVGEGVRWEAAKRLFDSSCERLGLNRERVDRLKENTFRRPSPQGELFG